MANNRRRMTGQVMSNKMDKTVVVQIERSYRHPLYGKVIREFKKFMAHDEENAAEVGDTVVLVESRPISRHKRWVIEEIVREDMSARMVEIEQIAEADVPIEELTAVEAPTMEVVEADADDEPEAEAEVEEAVEEAADEIEEEETDDADADEDDDVVED